MPREFQLTERLAGFSLTAARAGESVQVRTAEALTSLDGLTLTWRLEQLHSVLFSRVPGLPDPSQINHLVVVIDRELHATAYVNELTPVARAQVARPVAAGEPLYAADIVTLTAYELGVPTPDDCAVVVVRSYGWRRALFYDFGPIADNGAQREYDLSSVLAEQTLLLIAGELSVKPPADAVRRAIDELEALLRDECDEEARYQELLSRYPWFLGGQHTAIERHTNLDERNIPDFTGIRARDASRDLFEIKQPFIRCFRQDGRFTADFNAAWEQAERYLAFVRNNGEYLRNEKQLLFSNPRCFLLIGSGLSEGEVRRLQEREANTPLISVLTYEQVLRLGRALLAVIEAAIRSGPDAHAG